MPGYQLKAGSARTGPLPLHPMNTGDILDGAFKLFKANAASVLIIVAVITVPLQFVTSFFFRRTFSNSLLTVFSDPTTARAVSNQNSSTQLVLSVISGALALLTTPFIAGAISRVVAASYLGEQMSAGRALQLTLRRTPALLASFILVHLLEGVGFMLCFFPALAVSALYVLVAPAIAIEEIGPIKGMKRSQRLVRPRYWPVLGISMLAGILSYVLSSILGGAPQVVALLLGGDWAWLLIAGAAVMARLVAGPIVAIVATLLYFDARIRHEGLDLQLMAADLGPSGPLSGQARAAPSGPLSGQARAAPSGPLSGQAPAARVAP